MMAMNLIKIMKLTILLGHLNVHCKCQVKRNFKLSLKSYIKHHFELYGQHTINGHFMTNITVALPEDIKLKKS